MPARLVVNREVVARGVEQEVGEAPLDPGVKGAVGCEVELQSRFERNHLQALLLEDALVVVEGGRDGVVVKLLVISASEADAEGAGPQRDTNPESAAERFVDVRSVPVRAIQLEIDRSCRRRPKKHERYYPQNNPFHVVPPLLQAGSPQPHPSC
jgi:hypothetical protein